MSKPCMCIAIDVKNSRNMEKEELRQALVDCCNRVNAQYTKNVLVQFDVRSGDEMIGVIDSLGLAYAAAQFIEKRLAEKGIYLYIGLGIGTLDTVHSTIHTMNGSAVLNALDARDHFLKDKHPDVKPWLLEDKSSTFFFYTNEFPYQVLNAIHFSITEKKMNRSEKQKEAISLLEDKPGATYEQLGRELGYKSAKSTVSYLLSRAQYHTVMEMEKSLNQLLDEIEDRMNKGEK